MNMTLKTFLASLLTLSCAIQVHAAPASGSRPSSFTVLPAEYAASTITLSEDGSHLLIAHKMHDVISVWDVKTGKQVKVLSCPSPHHILCVGGNIYVANFGKGTISVFSGTSMTMADQLLVGDDSVYYLSAPHGKYFNGTILATCGKYSAHTVRSIDTKTDRNKELIKEIYMSVATVDYQGRHVIIQGETSLSPSATVNAYSYEDMLLGKKTSSGRGDHASTPVLRQVADSSFWFGVWGSQDKGSVYSGIPPKSMGGDFGKFAIPDHSGQFVYVLKDDTIEVVKLNMALSQINKTPISYPEEILKRHPPETARDYIYSHPQAVRHNKDVYIFIQRGPKVYRAVFPGLFREMPSSTATASEPGAGGTDTAKSEMPGKIVEGRPFQFPLFGKGVSGGKFTIITGSENARISSAGHMTWTPTAADVGVHNFKIKAVIEGNVSFKRFSVEVISTYMDGKVGGDLSKLEELGKHYLLANETSIESTHDSSGILLQSSRKLRILDRDGLLLLKSHDLEMPYRKMLSRKEYLVGLSANSVDLIDPTTLKLRRKIDLPGSGVNDMVLHPTLRLAYVAIMDSGGGTKDRIEAKQVVCVDESTGNVTPLPRTYGQWLAIDPKGTMLYSSIKDMVHAGYSFDWVIGDVLPRYGNVDIVISYAISGANANIRHTNFEPGANGSCMRVSPDGAVVSYVAGGGYRAGAANLVGYTIPAFDSSDIRKATMAYNVGAYPKDVSYHPTLNLVAGTSGKDVKIFNRTSGEEISGKLNLGDETISDVQRVFFTPGGKHLMVDCVGADKRRRFQSFPLVLTKEELALAGKPAKYAGPSAAAASSLSTGATAGPALAGIPRKPPLSSLKKLTARNESPMTTQTVHEKYANTIVVLKSDVQGGSGFFITSDGYILTCAHIIPKLSGFTVSYREPGPSSTMFTEKTAVPVVVAIDKKLDLAILKIETSKAVNYVRTEKSNVLASGEDVSTIGNPGLGGQILDYTITKGIVSNAARAIEGQTYIQTTAAVNPGSSGSPLFNSKGNVVGLVVLKGNIENTGFAVPIKRIYEFLATNADKEK